MIKVAIVGANGYTGFELMKILANHGEAKVKIAVSRSNAGTPIADLYAPLRNVYGDMKFEEFDADCIANECDVAFTALPHAASAEIGGKLFDKGVKIIDLSADFRYNSIDLFESTYKVTHPRPDLNEKAVYGLTEINRDKIKNSNIIGNPGCYTTTSILPLYPLLKEKLIKSEGIIIDAKSGITGAGRKSDVDYSFCEADGNFKAYGVTTHRHTTEIEEQLSFGSERLALSFTPHLLPVKRGILSTIYANLSSDISAEQISSVYNKYYGNEQFVQVCSSGKLPELKWVTGSNVCSIGFVVDKRLNRVIIVSVLDNLIKGASGQAVQNMNVMFGLKEETGLSKVSMYL